MTPLMSMTVAGAMETAMEGCVNVRPVNATVGLAPPRMVPLPPDTPPPPKTTVVPTG